MVGWVALSTTKVMIRNELFGTTADRIKGYNIGEETLAV